MAAISLPDNPSLERMRRRARALQQAVRAGDEAALERIAARHPDGAPNRPETFPLSAAQLVIARECGFASWPRLKHYFDVADEYRWDAAPNDPYDDPADRLCELACLTYADDGPDRWAQARRLLADHPGLTRANVWAAAAAADADAVRDFLGADPGLAHRRGGPRRWRPLYYLAYARLDVSAETVLTTARLLLDAGADPNEGYLWHGMPTPFTVLTGVFGEGEQGPERTPPHPHETALARLLLDAGADPNDGQTLYNRMFRPGNDHLRLLLSYGLGRGDGGPWRARLGEAVGSPAELLRYQLRWACCHGYLERVELLADHGADVSTPFDDGRTPAGHAARNGHAAIVDYLASRGVAAPDLSPVDAFAGAALRVDRPALDRLLARHPAVLEQARRDRPGLIVWAAAQGGTAAIALLAEHGFDVNALARTDGPVEQPWETALHHAAGTGNADQARLLLRLGADPAVRDARFDATPLGWAQYFGRQALVELLEPITQERA
ncbi:MAG TPA: ankyrin repeat domain-containing protein [Streptosporangiaceae bacterium]|jgi:ankyrin repeat protein